MQPDGPPISGELKQGEHLDTMVTFEPSKCYAVVGFSPANSIKNIKLRLLVGPLYGAAAAEGAIIGKGGPICPPSAMTYKLDVAALKGAGKIGAQVYSKAK